MAARDILVVDDDRKTVDLIALYLRHAGYSVRVAYDGPRALDLVSERVPDLLVLDLMLPRLDGLDVCRALRTGQAADVPVIMLTARTTEEDKLLGLETGADDYVTKPFSPRELVARVKAVLRRGGAGDRDADPASAFVRFGELEIDAARREVRRQGEAVRLTAREFDLLMVLARAPGHAFSRQGLLERAFGFDYDGLERTVDAHIANLRRKIEPDSATPSLIVTVQGFGYRLVPPDGPSPAC
jgi:DNA-binding response OmpR family regulator